MSFQYIKHIWYFKHHETILTNETNGVLTLHLMMNDDLNLPSVNFQSIVVIEEGLQDSYPCCIYNSVIFGFLFPD